MRKTILFIALLTSIISPQSINAQIDIGATFGQNFKSGTPPRTISEVVSGALNQTYLFALIAVLVYLIWGSFRYLISAGDPKAIQGAKAHLTWAIIGMIVIFISYWLFMTVNSLLSFIYA